MMVRITINDVKRQCRIEHDEEDELLAGYIDAAYDYAENFIGRALYDAQVPSDDDTGMVISPSINQACLMLIAHWYAHREAVVDVMAQVATIPFGVRHLLQPYRMMGV